MMLRARYSPRRLMLFLMGSVALTASSAFVTQIKPPGSWAFTVAWVGLVFFALCAVLCCLRLFDRREILVIDEQGLFDRRVLDKPVPWSAISRITELGVHKQMFFQVYLTSPIREFSLSRFKRFLLAANRPLGGDFYISAHGLTADTNQVRSALRGCAAAHPAVKD